jgi:hypothetical protein
MTPPPEDICVASTFLPLTNDWAEFWTDLRRRLRQRRIELLLLPTTSSDSIDFPFIRIPYQFSGFADLISPRPEWSTTGSATALLDSDAAWSGNSQPFADAPLGLHVCRHFYRAILDILRPSSVLAWNPTVPQSRIFLAEANERGVPSWGLERGLLPNTLMLESRSVSALTDLSLSPALRSTLRAHVFDPERVTQIRSHYLSSLPTKYPSRDHCDGASMRRRLGIPADAGMFCLFGSAEAANTTPRSNHERRLTSPFFANLPTAAAALYDALAVDPNRWLVIQAHPIDRPHLTLSQGTRLVVTDAENIHSLLAAADVCAVLGCSTVQFEALIHEKPLLLLSRSQLSGTSAAYEFAGGDLASVVEAAANRNGWNERRSAADRFLDFTCEHFLYGYRGAPVRHDLDSLCDLLADVRAPDDDTADTRLQRFADFLRSFGTDPNPEWEER